MPGSASSLVNLRRSDPLRGAVDHHTRPPKPVVRPAVVRLRSAPQKPRVTCSDARLDARKHKRSGGSSLFPPGCPGGNSDSKAPSALVNVMRHREETTRRGIYRNSWPDGGPWTQQTGRWGLGASRPTATCLHSDHLLPETQERGFPGIRRVVPAGYARPVRAYVRSPARSPAESCSSMHPRSDSAEGRRNPVWPSGIVGSMTHCTGYRAAAVARTGHLVALGVDAEPNGASREIGRRRAFRALHVSRRPLSGRSCYALMRPFP
ncbi:hypothetical protein [Streptomyces sp. NPDC058613]|uniref:hypothetical protein n=1 Tax=Streptomyces sp. NPDC058613 TaxID=3346556 RepID=UPI0036483EFA